MNKKTGIVILIVLVLIAGGWFLFTRRSPLSMEQVFPSQALMYVRLSYLEKDLDQYIKSSFWKNISDIDVSKILEHNHVSSRDIERLEKARKDLDAFIHSPLARKFLGREVGAAFYKKASGISDSADSYDVLFASRLGFSLQMTELFVSMARQWSDDIVTTNENYRGFKIIHVHFNKRKLDLQYTRIHDVLLASFFPSDILHRVIDVHYKRQSPLSVDPDFSKAFSRAYQQGHGILYVNVQKLFGIFNSHIPAQQKNNFQNMSRASTGFKSYTVSFLPGDISKMRMIMQFEPDQLSRYWRSLATCSGSDNPSLKFVPHNVVAYNWGQCYDFKELWTDVNDQKSSGSKEGVEKWEHRFEKRFKLNIPNDVLPVLGTQAGWYLNDVDTQGLFPYPRGVAFIKVENRPAAERLMDKITAKSFLSLQKEDYQHAAIYYMPLPLGVNMDPGYTFLGDYLLLGSSRESLRTSIDAFNNPNQSLLSSDTLKQFNINASDVTQGVAFMKIDDISGRIRQLLDWYNKVISSQMTGALAYEKEFKDRQQELEESFASKKEELALAQNKFKDLQSKVIPSDLSDEDKSNRQANIDHLTSDIKLLQEDVASFKEQEQELNKALVTYKNQMESAKLWLFNSDEIFKPLLNAFESFHALGMKWYTNGQMSETEILIK